MVPRGRRAAMASLVLVVGAACHSSRTAAPARTQSGHVRPWCRAPSSAAWKDALAGGVVALSRHASVVPWAVGSDGRTFFASLYSKPFSGVVRIDAASSRFTRIKRFADARNDQADG